MVLFADGFQECEMPGRVGLLTLFPEVFNMSHGESEDTNGRSEQGIGLEFISQFSNGWSVGLLVK